MSDFNTYRRNSVWARTKKLNSIGGGSHESPSDKAYRLTRPNSRDPVMTPNFATEDDREQKYEVSNHSQTAVNPRTDGPMK